ncbi:MAG: pro-sigmaK processing inhibitor BofA family protein [Bacillota bacterium]|nr:pro-sigmaK processing inhibitor BofA family protein [Bacillota bacterium]
MDFGMEVSIFLVYAAGLMAIYFLGRLLIVPIKTILKLLVNSLIGGVLLFLCNLFGGGLGIFLPLNMITAAIVGLLGIPGTVGILVYFNVPSLF